MSAQHGASARLSFQLSLRWRVAIAFGLASLAVAAVIGLTTWKLASQYMLEQRRQSATLQATVNERLVASSIKSGSDGLGELLTGLVVDPGSSILLDLPTGWLSSGRPIDPADLPPDLLDPTSTGVRWLTTDVNGIPILAIALPGSTADSRFIELFPLVELHRIQRFLTTLLIAGAGFSGLLGVGLGWWTSKRALRPLTELTALAGKVAAGDLSLRLTHRGDRDLARLAATFNATIDSLEERVRQDARFAGDVSHELRSPLTTMVNAIEILLRRRATLPPVAQQAVVLLNDEIQHFQQMVVDLLEISRTQLDDSAHSLELVDLGVLVANVAARRAGVPDQSANPAFVLADRRRLTRVVVNLLDNADKHGGGAVRIAVTSNDTHVRLEVDDAGPGVPEEARTHIFERFAKGARSGDRGIDDGSGLGLALVTQHVRLHHGSVWVESRPAGGARFIVELPTAAARLESTRSSKVADQP